LRVSDDRTHARLFLFNALTSVKNPIDSFSQYADMLASLELILNDVGSWFKQRLSKENLNELLELVNMSALKHEKDKWT